MGGVNNEQSGRVTRRSVLAGSFGVAATALQRGGGASSAPAATGAPAFVRSQANEGGTLTFATNSPWGALSIFKPVLHSRGYSSNIPAFLTHSRLASLDGSGTLHPDLAERWEMSPDATTYTYMLRRDVTFSDGTPVTARDVEATVRLYLTREANINPVHWIGHLKGGQEFYEGTATEVPGMQVLDEYTISFELKAPFPAWDTLSVSEMNILPAHIYSDIDPAGLAEEYAATWFTPEAHIGSGPFKFVTAEHDRFVELARNDTYFGGRPKLDRVLFRNFGNEDTQYISFEKGEIDVWNVPSNFIAQAEDLPNVTLHQINRRYIRVFQVNSKRPYLADQRVRQALLYAIDRQALIDQLLNGLGVPWNSFVESDKWVAQGLHQYEYNPDRAMQLLAEAGWDADQTIVLGYDYNDTLHRDWFAAIQQQLALVGVRAQPELGDGTVWGERIANCDYDLFYQGWGFTDHPAVYRPKFTCTEAGCEEYYCNPQVEELFATAQTTADEQQQRALYDEIQRIVNDALPLLPIAKFFEVTGVNNRVSGFDEDALWMMHHPWQTGFNNAVNWAVSS